MIYARGIGRCVGPFPGQPIDPDDPPVYESQPDYLRRHNLLLPGEAQRLTAADFAPEVVRPDNFLWVPTGSSSEKPVDNREQDANAPGDDDDD